MIPCRCPNCSAKFQFKASQFGQTVSCSNCSYSWILDNDNIVRYQLPKTVTVYVQDASGTRIPDKVILIEYNHPLLSIKTDQQGIAVVTEEMIQNGLSEFISSDGIMDHRYDDPSCQKYLHLSVSSKRQSIDLSDYRDEIKIRIVV